MLAVVFVNFVFSNTVYTHCHTDANGNPVAHSHPYVPSSGHAHSQAQLDNIANFNQSSGAFVAAPIPVLSHFDTPQYLAYAFSCRHIVYGCPTVNSLRAPPSKIEIL